MSEICGAIKRCPKRCLRTTRLHQAARRRPAGMRLARILSMRRLEVDDLEMPTVAVKTFADLRQMPKLTEHESGSRVIAAVRRKGDGQAVCHFVSRHAARDQPRSIIAPHGFRFDPTFIGSESTSNRFQDVRICDDSLKLAVLVVNKRHMDR